MSSVSRPTSPSPWDRTTADLADPDDKTAVPSGPATRRGTPTSSPRRSMDRGFGSHVDDLEKALPLDMPPLDPPGPREGDGAGGDMDLANKHQEDAATRPRLPLRHRLAHFTWAWYTLSMSTGGLALLIAAQPHAFPGLRHVGLAVHAANCLVFALITAALAARFALHRGALRASVTHPREGWFFPTSLLALATVVTGTYRYGVADPAAQPGLVAALRAAFWAYVAAATAVAVGQYSLVFSERRRFALPTMMPTWILPVFPVMLSGTMATVVAGPAAATATAAPGQSPAHAAAIAAAGLTCQGLGAAVALIMYAHMVGRLMQAGLPHREHRTGLFMCVGPPAFTALAFVGLAKAVPDMLDSDTDGLRDAAVLRTMGMVGAAFLWALSFWWFGIAALAVARAPPQDFHLGWWAVVFPNTGFTLATIALGEAFQNDAVLWFASAMSAALAAAYLFVLYHHVRAVVVQDIMYPGRDEDVEDL
ncbi:hypothetical protein VTJ83DRAFT_2778 [Remersonia thermophila]|uniref:Malic acid transport protein n=1 Tax=Remersonia thermophila TaxID=72144 RepID=A0ABR4DJT0_9PEZI